MGEPSRHPFGSVDARSNFAVKSMNASRFPTRTKRCPAVIARTKRRPIVMLMEFPSDGCLVVARGHYAAEGQGRSSAADQVAEWKTCTCGWLLMAYSRCPLGRGARGLSSLSSFGSSKREASVSTNPSIAKESRNVAKYAVISPSSGLTNR